MQHARTRPESRCTRRSRRSTNSTATRAASSGSTRTTREQLAFSRSCGARANGSFVVVASNFTPVVRERFRLGVPRRRHVPRSVSTPTRAVRRQRRRQRRRAAQRTAAGHGRRAVARYCTLPPLATRRSRARIRSRKRCASRTTRRGLARAPVSARCHLGRQRRQLRALFGERREGRTLSVRCRADGANCGASCCPNTPIRSGTAICPTRGRAAVRVSRLRPVRSARAVIASTITSCLLDPYADNARRLAALERRALRLPRRIARAPTCRSTGATTRPACRSASSSIPPSRGATIACCTRAGTNRSSTNCTCAASRCSIPDVPARLPRHVRGTLLAGRRSTTCTASASRPSSCCRFTRSSTTATSSSGGCATTGATTRSVSSPPIRAISASGDARRVQDDGQAICTTPASKSSSTSSSTTRPKATISDRRFSFAASTTSRTTASCPATSATTSTRPAAETRSICANPHVLQMVMDSLRYWAQRNARRRFSFRSRHDARARRRGHFEWHSGFLTVDHARSGARRAQTHRRAVGPRRRTAIRSATSRRAGRSGTTSFRDSVRRFWQGNDGIVPDLASRLTGSSDLFDHQRAASAREHQLRYRARRFYARRPRLVQRQAQRRQPRRQSRRHRTTTISWNCGVEGADRRARSAASAHAAEAQLLRDAAALARACRCCSPATSSVTRSAATTTPTAKTTKLTWLDWELLKENAALVDVRAYPHQAAT